jgi:hypothetical protein
MSQLRNRAQRREDLRRAKRNRKEQLESRAAEKRRLARMDERHDAPVINRDRAMRAAGIEVPEKSWKTFFDKPDMSSLLIVVILLSTMIGSYHAFNTSASHEAQAVAGQAALAYRGKGALSIV